MKTTNFEISKKLKEIGFKKDSHCGYIWDGDAHQLCVWNRDQEFRYVNDCDYLAYDLETILEALPKEIVLDMKDKCFEFCHPNLQNEAIYQQENESLADIAARLLILLHEKGIVKFKEL